jgi:hypothetical protein
MPEIFNPPPESETRTELNVETLGKKYKEATPAESYGEISLTSTRADFIKNFKQALINGEAQNFLDVALAEDDPYSKIFNAKINSEKNIIYKNFTDSSLQDINSKLLELQTELQASDQIPPALAHLYAEKITNELNFIQTAKGLATPEFTLKQHSDTDWRRNIDWPRSLEQGGVVFPAEQQAWAMLEQSAKPNEHSLAQALDFWQFSESEKAELPFLSEIKEKEFLNAEEIVAVLNVLIRRLNLEGWEARVDDKATMINVDAKAQKINVPPSRQVKGDEAIYIFGHERQQEFALRYVIAAMLAKTKPDEQGQLVPKYDLQEVFSRLQETGAKDEKIAMNMWRALRGTSLKRQVVELELDGQKIPMCETFIKDMCYFRGQSQMYAALSGAAEFYGTSERKERLLEHSHDFNEPLLARIGLAVKKNQDENYRLSLGERQQIHQELVGLGREQILNLLDQMTIGKMSLEQITNMDSDLKNIIDAKRPQMSSYRDIFIPREEDNAA